MIPRFPAASGLPSREAIQALLADPDPARTEQLAQEAARLTRQFFGRAIALYSPIYLSNYCSSHCTYCGFHSHHRIQRRKLSAEQMESEMRQVAATGIENILLLTGESPRATPLAYLTTAATLARRHFTGVSMEIYPLDEAGYRELFLAGVDGITVYQETYDRARYQEVHLAGQKRDYDYRYGAPERVARAGMRQLSMGVLLGLGDAAGDLAALYQHLRGLERAYPGVEYSLSFPRLRRIKGQTFAVDPIDDITLIRIICLSRILFPRVGINLSTREGAWLRDHALGLGVTRISAGSSTAVGGYGLCETPSQEPQFDVQDDRSVAEIIQALKDRAFDPVLTDWRPIQNS